MQISVQNIIFVIITITLIFVVVAIFILLYVRLYNQRKKKHVEEKISMSEDFERQLLQSQVEVQESTFQHIGKELHDNVGQLLGTTKMLLGVTEMKMQIVPETLLAANATLSKAIQELRLVARSLDKEWLEQFVFLDNLYGEIDRINAGGVIIASCNCSIAIDMKADEQIVLFRIVQEAIQNAIKHGTPSKLDLLISKIENHLQIGIVDDGYGIPTNFSGMGTSNMKHRTQLLGGTITWQSQEPKGTIVTIHLPLKNVYEN